MFLYMYLGFHQTVRAGGFKMKGIQYVHLYWDSSLYKHKNI